MSTATAPATAAVADGIKRDRGVIVALVYQGREYRVPQTTDADFCEVEDYLNGLRRPPLEALKEQFAGLADVPGLQDRLVREAYRDTRLPDAEDGVTAAEVQDYVETRKGAIRFLWIKLRRNYPELTLDDAARMFSACTDAAVAAAVDDTTRAWLIGKGFMRSDGSLTPAGLAAKLKAEARPGPAGETEG